MVPCHMQAVFVAPLRDATTVEISIATTMLEHYEEQISNAIEKILILLLSLRQLLLLLLLLLPLQLELAPTATKLFCFAVGRNVCRA